MKKSSLFISAILTTFVLVVLSGAVSAYRFFAASNAQVPIPVVQANTQVVTQEVDQPTATTAWLTPQEGAQLAAMYLGRSDLYSVEPDFMNGVNVYKVTFTSGDLAYVSMDGQIFRVVMAASPAVQAAALSSNNNHPETFEHENDDD